MTEAVEKAARWMAVTPRDKLTGRPLIPYLRQAFGLTAKQAVDAIREANLIRARAH